MIKRPGNEDYLAKVMEEERKAYLKVLDVNVGTSVGGGGGEGTSDGGDSDDGGLTMGKHHVHED